MLSAVFLRCRFMRLRLQEQRNAAPMTREGQELRSDDRPSFPMPNSGLLSGDPFQALFQDRTDKTAPAGDPFFGEDGRISSFQFWKRDS